MATRPQDVGTPSVIETARLRLEPWSDAHFERFARFMRDPAVIRYIRAEPLDRASARRATRALARRVGAVRIRETRDHRGRDVAAGSDSSSCRSSAPARGRATTTSRSATSCDPTAGAQGIATEAAIASRDEAFGRCGLDELIGRCRVENVASARVLAKVGFRRLRLFELDDGIIVEIHRLQRAALDDHRPAIARASCARAAPPSERSTVRRASSVAVVDRRPPGTTSASSTTSSSSQVSRAGSACGSHPTRARGGDRRSRESAGRSPTSARPRAARRS